MSLIALIIALALYGYSFYQLVRDDFAWWRERVRRAEGVPGDLQPVEDLPDVVAVRQAVEPAVRLVGLIHGPVVELHPGQDVTVPASPAALRRLLCCVLHAAAQGRARSGVEALVGISVRVVGIQVDNPASLEDIQALLRRSDPTYGSLARAVRPLGWGATRVVSPGQRPYRAPGPANRARHEVPEPAEGIFPYQRILVDVRWSPVEMVECGDGWAS